MAEIFTRPDVFELFWNSLATFPANLPPVGKRQAGYDPGTGNDDGEVPAGDHWNALWKEAFLTLNYLADSYARTFEDIHHALELGTPGEEIAAGLRFYVTPDIEVAGKNRWFGQTVFNISGPGTGVVQDVCCDGEQIYFKQSGGIGVIYAVAVSPDDGVEIWKRDLSGDIVTIACDGSYVWYSQLAQVGLLGLDRVTGAPAVGIVSGAESQVQKIAVNGSMGIGIAPAGTNYRIVFYDLVALNEDAVVDVTGSGQLQACCIDREYAYAGGKRAGGSPWYKIHVYDLQTQALFWESDLALGSGIDPDINAMCLADDTNLFVAHQRIDRTGGGDWANLTMFDKYGLGELAHYDIAGGAGGDAINVAFDGEFLYVTLANYTVYKIRPRDLSAIYRYAGVLGASRNVYCCDGVSLIGSDGATHIRRDWSGEPNKAFQKVKGQDDTRPPWCYNLAIPAK